MDETTVVSEAFDALSHPYRQQLLVSLSTRNPQEADSRDPIAVVMGVDESSALRTELVHHHLPKLHRMGFIEWDRATNKISRGDAYDEIEPLIELIRDNRGELPDTLGIDSW